ncbi:MAG: type II toxin-antitoxin system Phd/YefM family antitoxin [Deltaproteobacteria bacterium]|nr:type II toxin-antitoxin system Phd/YefM family antitoxin [Deltaproteobacteria bacterium]
MKTMTSVEAQNHFGLLLDTAQREPVTITRRGRAVAYLLSPQEFAALSQGTATDSTRELLAAFRGSGKGGGVARLVAEREAERLREA